MPHDQQPFAKVDFQSPEHPSTRRITFKVEELRHVDGIDRS
jgi:hypothetical protein